MLCSGGDCPMLCVLGEIWGSGKFPVGSTAALWDLQSLRGTSETPCFTPALGSVPGTCRPLRSPTGKSLPGEVSCTGFLELSSKEVKKQQ